MKICIDLAAPSSAACRAVGAAALDALRDELMLHPKPGLVTPFDQGAHRDMDVHTFRASIAALAGYFPAIAQAGADGCGFEILRDLGMTAERRMLAATNGVNTHRGAVFCMGFLAAAAGWAEIRGASVHGDALGRLVVELWGDGIAEAGRMGGASHGAKAVRAYGLRGARDEALDGFPTLFETALPALDAAMLRLPDTDHGRRLARIQTLFAIMAELDDTNLAHRGGLDGLRLVQDAAADFLAAGGVFAPDWRERARCLEALCKARHLSPGGAADMLAAASFMRRLQRGR